MPASMPSLSIYLDISLSISDSSCVICGTEIVRRNARCRSNCAQSSHEIAIFATGREIRTKLVRSGEFFPVLVARNVTCLDSVIQMKFPNTQARFSSCLSLPNAEYIVPPSIARTHRSPMLSFNPLNRDQWCNVIFLLDCNQIEPRPSLSNALIQ